VAENCTGQAAACPADGFASSNTVCRADTGECDVAENCTGAGALCPDEAPAGTCDDGLFCNGTDTCVDDACTGHSGDPCAGGGICGDSCSEETDSCFDVAGTVCRPSGGVCDVAETCTGSNADCPTNSFTSGNTCRGSNGVCDVAETCSGTAAACPADGFTTGGTCRASGGVCDVAETCSGTSASCPANGFASGGTCRASGGVCDLAETCSGTAAACPADGFVAGGTICRADAGDCDVADTCTGSAAACPANGFEPNGTTCTTDGNVCTNDTCNGTGTCQHTNNTVDCDDGLFCTANDKCGAGQCSGAARNCGDGIGCTEDDCNEATDSCDHDPQNDECTSDDPCLTGICDISEGCVFIPSCENICRSSNFYSKRAGGDDNVVQQILHSLEEQGHPLRVCGETITETSIDDSVAGLGLDSALEGLCVRPDRIPIRSLYRELVATGLNCAMSGSRGDDDFCDEVVATYVDAGFSYSECNDLCAGELELNDEEYALLTSGCIDQLNCYNNGGTIVDGLCAYGKCDVTREPCGGDYGTCPPINVIGFPLLQVCERFADNCRDESFCAPALEVCPDRLPNSGTRACKEAKKNDCTIDDCSIDDD